MRQQGQYLAAIRPLKAQDRAKVKTVRTEKDFAAAMAEALQLAKFMRKESDKCRRSNHLQAPVYSVSCYFSRC